MKAVKGRTMSEMEGSEKQKEEKGAQTLTG